MINMISYKNKALLPSLTIFGNFSVIGLSISLYHTFYKFKSTI